MAQTKHLSFLVIVSILLGTFSFYQVDNERIPNSVNTQARSISSESDPIVIVNEQLHKIDNDLNQNREPIEGDLQRREDEVHSSQNRSIPNDVALAQEHITKLAEAVAQHAGSCPQQVDAAQLCRLPKTFIPPELYQKCCRGASCLPTGVQCSRASTCCSGMCVDGYCAANAENKLYPDEICKTNSDCYSNICDYRPNSVTVKICYGNNTTNYCSRVTQSCTLNKHCCSNKCSRYRCIGSQLEKSPIGYPCSGDHSECLSGFCNLQSRRCE